MIIRCVINFFIWGFVHVILIPFLIDSNPAPEWMPYKRNPIVSVDRLNVRLDSSTEAYAIGYLKKYQPVQVLEMGKKWARVYPEKLHYYNRSDKDRQYDPNQLYVWNGYLITERYKLGTLYVNAILLLQIIGLIVVINLKRPAMFKAFLNYVFSFKTIPLLFQVALNGLFSKISKTGSLVHSKQEGS
ncbi:MAG: SH3 domain-containing protein [Cyclobacteriaceae bacterium]